MSIATRPATQRHEVHIIVTCANRKLHTIPRDLRLQDLRQQRLPGRFANWVSRLTTSTAPAIPAERLYGGEHWQIARTLTTLGTRHGHTAHGWVCSAGYGLAAITAPLRPYAATFAAGRPDSVGDSTSAMRQWWDHHSMWTGPAPGTPRSLAALTAQAPNAAFLVVLSSNYLRACAHDLLAAVANLHRPEQLSIICAGASEPSDLQEFLVPADARLQTVLGGSLQALNVRIAARLLELAAHTPLDRPVLTEYLKPLTREIVPRPALRRSPLTDAQVREFITARLTDRSTHSALLRQLRDAGYACEQQRFARLFTATVGSR